MICHIQAHFSYLSLCSQPFFKYRLSVTLAYYLMCCLAGMKYLLAAELRQLPGSFHCLILLAPKKPFLQATICFLNNSVSPMSDSVKLNGFRYSVRWLHEYS